jgi:hypothetical protein
MRKRKINILPSLESVDEKVLAAKQIKTNYTLNNKNIKGEVDIIFVKETDVVEPTFKKLYDNVYYRERTPKKEINLNRRIIDIENKKLEIIGDTLISDNEIINRIDKIDKRKDWEYAVGRYDVLKKVYGLTGKYITIGDGIYVK